MNFVQSTPFSPERARQIRQRHERERRRDRSPPASGRDSAQGHLDETDSHSRGRTTRDKYESEDAANLSPWQGLGSPSSSSASEFESIPSSQRDTIDSDVEIVLNPTLQPRRTGSLSSEYARSISRRGRDRSLSVEEEQELGRGVEGDDEDSSAFEDAGGDEGRGRGRTRERRRDPELKRSMLEDALRSSLSTILSLAPAHTKMSQTPQMSQVSLASLLSTPRSAFQTTPPTYPSTSRPSFPTAHRPSPFASSLAARFEDEEEEEDDEEDYLAATVRTPRDDVLTTSSEDEDDQTELSPYTQTTTTTSSRAIPIPSRQSSRSQQVSASREDDASFSPLQPSRPLGMSSSVYSTSETSPLHSRRRGGRRGRGTTRGRGHGAASSSGFGGGGGDDSLSPGPGPASLEERRRARMLAAQSGWTQGERGGTTDVEDESVQPDEAFAELLSAARFFSDLSPRASHTRSLPNSFDSTRTTRAALPSFHSASTPVLSRGRGEEEDEDEEEEDPALASESVPTLGGLSSSAEGSRSPASRDSPEQTAKSKPKKLKEDEKPVEGGKDRNEKKRGGGWLSWFGIGKTIELKVWHLVGLCGVLVGVGWGASTLIRSYVLPNASSLIHSTENNSSISRFEFAPLPMTPLERPSTSSMSSLFL